MRKVTVPIAVLAFLATSALATDRVDSIRVSVRSGSHTISTAAFPNGVWFQLPGGVRESSKASPPFPTVPPGMTTTVTFDLLSNPDTVIGANFDMSMDAVPHPGQNLFSGASWLSHLNLFGDLLGHGPNDADIMYQLVLRNASLTKVSPLGTPIKWSGSGSVPIVIKAIEAPGQVINASSDKPASISITPSATTGPDSTATFTATLLAGKGGTANLTFSHGANTLVVPIEIVGTIPALTPLGLAILLTLLAGTAAYYLLRRKKAAA